MYNSDGQVCVQHRVAVLCITLVAVLCITQGGRFVYNTEGQVCV